MSDRRQKTSFAFSAVRNAPPTTSPTVLRPSDGMTPVPWRDRHLPWHGVKPKMLVRISHLRCQAVVAIQQHRPNGGSPGTATDAAAGQGRRTGAQQRRTTSAGRKMDSRNFISGDSSSAARFADLGMPSVSMRPAATRQDNSYQIMCDMIRHHPLFRVPDRADFGRRHRSCSGGYTRFHEPWLRPSGEDA